MMGKHPISFVGALVSPKSGKAQYWNMYPDYTFIYDALVRPSKL